jgi:hypothetical protein
MRGKDRMNRKINKEVNDNAAAVVAVVAIWRAIKRRKNRKDRLYVTSECLDRRRSVTSVCRLPNDTPHNKHQGRMVGECLADWVKVHGVSRSRRGEVMRSSRGGECNE